MRRDVGLQVSFWRGKHRKTIGTWEKMPKTEERETLETNGTLRKIVGNVGTMGTKTNGKKTWDNNAWKT